MMRGHDHAASWTSIAKLVLVCLFTIFFCLSAYLCARFQFYSHYKAWFCPSGNTRCTILDEEAALLVYASTDSTR
uniref:Putative secreted protein n=1 Tax=Anopheles darlingi TaxID=43151 RepID=A0A2M4D4C0_ANODA